MPNAATLALVGGPPAVRRKLHRRSPRHGWREKLALWRAAGSSPQDLTGPDSRWVTDFERAVARHVGVADGVAVANPVDALWATLVAFRVDGWDVIVSELGGLAGHAVLQAGGTPVFCDVDPNGSLDVHQLERLVNDATRAIVVSHTHGQPANLAEIHRVATQHDVLVIEDATEALGAHYHGRPIGNHGSDAVIVSAHADSPLAAGGGALVLMNDDHLALAVRRATRLGIDSVQPGPGEFAAHWPRYFGQASRMSPLDAALALARLPKLEAAVTRAQRNASELVRGLRPLAGLLLPPLLADRHGTFHRFPIRLDVGLLGWDGPAVELRDAVVRALQAEGVPASVLPWQPLSRLPMHRRGEPWLVRFVERPERPLHPWHFALCPTAAQIVDDTIVLGDADHRLADQPPALMPRWVDAVRKVIANLDVLHELPLEPLRAVPPIPSIDLAIALLDEGPETC